MFYIKIYGMEGNRTLTSRPWQGRVLTNYTTTPKK